LPISNDEPTILGKSLPSAMHDDGETCAKTCDDTTRPENETWLSPSLGTRFRKWGRPMTKERTKNGTTPVIVIVAKLRSANKSKQNKMLGSGGRTRSSLGTYTLTYLRH
jgi:hypothetical protein